MLSPVLSIAQGTWLQVYDTTTITSEVYNLRKVIYANGRFMSAGYIAPSSNGIHSSGNGSPLFMESSDGTSWNNISPNLNLNYGYIYDLKYINNHYLAVGTYNTQETGYNDRILILSSSDGYNWTQTTTISDNNELSGSASAVAYGNGIYALSISGYIYYSSDLQNWTRATHDYTAYTWNHITFANNKFIATGGAVTSEYRMISSDGIHWSKNRESGEPGGNRAIEYLNGAFYNTAYSNGIASSSDGLNWKDITPALFTRTALGIDYANETFVIGGGSPGQTGNYSGYITVSSDYQTWWSEKLNEYIEGGLISVAHNDSAFVAITYKGNIYYSAFSSSDNSPSLTSGNSINTALNQTLEYTITTSNMTADHYQIYRLKDDSNQIDYSNTGLPNGLSYDYSSGVISGTAKESGTFRFALRAYNYSTSVGDRELGTILTITISETSADNSDANNSDSNDSSDNSGDNDSNSGDSSNTDGTSSSDSNTSTSNSISDWIARSDVSYQAVATFVQDSEGYRLNGGVWNNGRPNSEGEYDGNGIQSSQNYNFIGTTSYAKFKLNGGGQYAAWTIRPWYLPMHHLNTHHSWASGLLVDEDTWVYATYEIGSDSQWSVSLASGNYKHLGGSELHSESGTLTEDQISQLKSSPFLVTFGDNYGGTDAYMILAEVKITSANGSDTCTDATLSSHLKMHFPYLSYQPLFGDKLNLWVNSIYVAEKTSAIYFKVTEYGVISDEQLPGNNCTPATLSSSLQLLLPSLKYSTANGTVYDLDVEFQLESESDGTLYLKVLKVTGLE